MTSILGLLNRGVSSGRGYYIVLRMLQDGSEVSRHPFGT